MFSFVLYRLVHTAVFLYSLVLIARGLLPLLGMSYAHPVMLFVYNVTEPLLAPIRRRMPPTGAIDLSPLVLLIILWLLEQIIIGILF